MFVLSHPCLCKNSSVAWACSPLIQRDFALVVTRVKVGCQNHLSLRDRNGMFTMPERTGYNVVR